VIHVYAITAGLDGLPEVEGIGGAPPQRLSCDGFDLVVSEHDELEATEDAVVAHARVVEKLVPLTDALLPARFGLEFDDKLSLEEAVQKRGGKLGESLEHVRGRVELGLRVVGGEPGEEEPPPATGRAYLEARAAENRLGRELHESLAARADGATRAEQPDPRLVLSSAYLVDPDTIPAFLGAVEELKSQHPGLTFALTGPWPPYNFAGVDEP
jgi:hypothetical protein